MTSQNKLAVVAVGGNALIRDEQHRSIADQYDTARETVRHVVDMIEAGWRLVNLDLTIACETPRIGPHVSAMRDALSRVLAVSRNAVSVKATTTEKLGFCGRGEGIAAMAIVLVQAAE